MTNKTEVETYLDTKGIQYEVIEFATEEKDGVAVLKELPVEEELLAKTLVLKGNKSGPVIALMPWTGRLDYKKAAKATGNRKIGFPPVDVMLSYTGYEHGANTPIGIYMQHPDYPLLADDALRDRKTIVVSSGVIGRSIELAMSDLIQLVHPQFTDLSVEEK